MQLFQKECLKKGNFNQNILLSIKVVIITYYPVEGKMIT